MTVKYTADVFCDRCGNWEPSATATGNTSSGLARQALSKSSKHGWSRNVRSIYLDICPTCLGESEKPDGNESTNESTTP